MSTFFDTIILIEINKDSINCWKLSLQRIGIFYFKSRNSWRKRQKTKRNLICLVQTQTDN